MPTFETTDYAQMRRCRMAHLHGQTIDEVFGEDGGPRAVSGYVQSVRPDLTCWPLRWTIVVGEQVLQHAPLAMTG